MERADGRSRPSGSTDEPATLESSGLGTAGDPDGDVREAVLRMCHDLVTPAVAIRHLAAAIEATPDLSPIIRRQVALIAAESTHISEICAFTLEVVREPRPVRLDEIVVECVAGARSWFEGTIDVRADPVVLRAQRVPMLRLVSNLLNNACQAAGSGGSVSIRLDHDRYFADLEVINSGAQLEPAMDLGTDRFGRPSTLGLRIVSEILAGHHGRGRIESHAPGGTKVHIQVPLNATGDEPGTDRRPRADR